MKLSYLPKLIQSKIFSAWEIADQVARSKAVGTIEYEVEELDNIFALLVFGAFIGITAPPIHLTLEMLPMMEREINIMLDKVATAHDPLGDLFSVLDID